MKQEIIARIRCAVKFFREYGLFCFIQHVFFVVRHEEEKDYYWWSKKHRSNKKDLKKQKESRFLLEPTFSIIVSVRCADKQKRQKLIRSLRKQTYNKWEICLADGGENIAENINQALELAIGEYIVFIREEDILEINTLYECVRAINQCPDVDFLYTDEDEMSIDGKQYFHPHFKSDYNLDLLRSKNYVGHFFVLKKKIQEQVGRFCEELYYEYEYDYILRCMEVSKNIWHIPKVLYHKRISDKKEIVSDEKIKVIKKHMERCQVVTSVNMRKTSGICKVNYLFKTEPFISIIIPNRNHIDDLKRCIDSVYEISEYSNFEIIIVENGSDEKRTFMYYKDIVDQHKNVRIVTWRGIEEFNYSALNNFGVINARGKYLLFLNNDTRIINKNCLSEMVSHVIREEVGAVGAKLYYPDGTIQHAGVILGLGGIAGHAFCGEKHDAYGYFSRIQCTQNLTAVTAACMMMPRVLFDEIGGFDENLKVAFNDVDLCMKIRKKGKWIVYTPYAELYHYESKSRGIEDTEEKVTRFRGEVSYFAKKWKKELEAGDPYYNPNLTLRKNDFSLKIL